MNTLQATLTLNNRGVELFHSNYFPEAAKTYYQSLRAVTTLLKHPELNLSRSTNALDNDSLPDQQACFHSSTQPSTNMITQENKLFVYQSALVLQESASADSLEAMNIYCAGILFNAAILHHQAFMKNGSSMSMDRAQKLYQSSLQLLNALPDAGTHNDTVALLVVANHNNLAHIELEKGLVLEASQRLCIVSQLLHTSQPTIDRVFSKSEFQGFLTNSLMANGMIASPAA